MEALFYITGLLCIYSYFIYPLILKFTPARQLPELAALEENELPKLSLIIAAHNEQDRIREKLENTLEIDYPANQLEEKSMRSYVQYAKQMVKYSFSQMLLQKYPGMLSVCWLIVFLTNVLVPYRVRTNFSVTMAGWLAKVLTLNMKCGCAVLSLTEQGW